MADMERLQERLYEKLHRRPAGIDRMDRLWEAAVLLPSLYGGRTCSFV